MTILEKLKSARAMAKNPATSPYRNSIWTLGFNSLEAYELASLAANHIDQLIEVIEVQREALNDIARSYTKCSECDGGEFKYDQAKEAIDQVNKILERKS